MANLRDIKSRIHGVKKTQQITKAMKMVAAARLKKAQDAIISARPYSRKITEMLGDLLAVEKETNSPLTEKRDVKKAAVVMVSSDKGLCGGFNVNVIRKFEELMEGDYKELKDSGNLVYYAIGKKANEYFRRHGIETMKDYVGIFGKHNFEFAVGVVNELKQMFLDGEVDEVKIVYNEFKSVMQQNTKAIQLLPIEPEVKEDSAELKNVDYIYEPDKASIISSLLPRYLNVQMWKIILDSYAAELGARMTAMDMATENAKDLISDLQLTYNKERQASITTEILEIVSGANALKEG